jgi:hypothetical protein
LERITFGYSGTPVNEFQRGEKVAALGYGGAAVTVGEQNELQKLVQNKP